MLHGTSSTARRLRNTLVVAALLLCGVAATRVAESIAHADQPAPPPPPPVRETPSRGEISQTLGALAGDVRACTPPGTPAGVITVNVQFESSGVVRRVTSAGSPLPTAVTLCIIGAVQKARVAPFRAAEFNVSFPYRYGS